MDGMAQTRSKPVPQVSSNFSVSSISLNQAVTSVYGTVSSLNAGASAVLVDASPGATTIGFVGFLGYGDTDALFQVFIDGVPKYFDLTDIVNQRGEYTSSYSEAVAPGHTLKLVVTNKGTGAANYYGTVAHT